jgi:Ni/Co efflux regulator RcnB
MKTILPVVGLLALAVPAAASAEVVRAALWAGDEAVLIKVDHKPKHRGKGHGKHGRYDHDDWDDRRDERRAYHQGVRDGRAQAHEEYRRYTRGEYLPYEYRREVLYDYRRYDLPPPPYGHHYVQAGGDTYLIQMATGLIMRALGGGY